MSEKEKIIMSNPDHTLILSLVEDVLNSLADVEAPLTIADPLESAILAYNDNQSDENLAAIQKASLAAQEWLANNPQDTSVEIDLGFGNPCECCMKEECNCKMIYNGPIWRCAIHDTTNGPEIWP
jgi:hypothetical protein